MRTKSPSNEYDIPYRLLKVRNNNGERFAITDIERLALQHAVFNLP